jgi:hypothetical protein
VTTAKLRVATELLGELVLPSGFSAIWEKDLGVGVVELIIDGPFDPSLPDGAAVEAEISQYTIPHRHLKWQWKFAGNKCGDPIELPWP